MSKVRKIFISGFIILNFLSMIRIHLPMDNKFLSAIYKPVDSYLSFFSLYQSWTMFAPDPSRANVHLSAEVEFMDGTKDTYFFPQASTMNLEDKFAFGERYRVISDVIRKDQNDFLWADTAKFALRKLRASNYHKIPLKVNLVRHWNEIPDVKSKFIPHLTKDTDFNSYEFFTYEVL